MQAASLGGGGGGGALISDGMSSGADDMQSNGCADDSGGIEHNNAGFWVERGREVTLRDERYAAVPGLPVSGADDPCLPKPWLSARRRRLTTPTPLLLRIVVLVIEASGFSTGVVTSGILADYLHNS